MVGKQKNPMCVELRRKVTEANRVRKNAWSHKDCSKKNVCDCGERKVKCPDCGDYYCLFCDTWWKKKEAK